MFRNLGHRRSVPPRQAPHRKAKLLAFPSVAFASFLVMTPRHLRPTKLPQFLFGICYYPEHWTAADMVRDAELMAAAGVNTARLAEFAWNLLEPRPGQFDFAWLDTAIDRLANYGIKVALGTPTASPPIWMTEQHPDWLRIDQHGRPMIPGSRQHACTSNPGFREASRHITAAMAEHYAEHPQVIGWQTDNEFHCHFSECHCPACQAAFRRWLATRYGTVEALNTAWGTAFWAQTYDRFEQIRTPIADRPTHANPSQDLDYRRFLSDMTIEFQREQTEILRAANPNWWITHNGIFQHIDLWRFAEDLDFLSVDVYPGFAPQQPAGSLWASRKLEECRAASGSFTVPEQQGGPGGQRPYIHEILQPGQMRLWSWQSVARGADGILHFRWRTARFGAETYWHGILDHDNIPRRRYEEFAQKGRELARLGPTLLGTVERIEAATLVEIDQDEAHESIHLGLPSPNEQRRLAFEQMAMRHWASGLVDARDSFAGLRLIVLPSFPLVDEALAQRLRSFVESGGCLIATARSGIRDRRNHALSCTLPGPLASLFGITVEEAGKTSGSLCLQLADSAATVPHGGWYEILHPTTAEVFARWKLDSQAPHAAVGQPAASLNRVGQGIAFYLGTFLSDDNTASLFEAIAPLADLQPLAEADPFVEIVCRQAADRSLLFVLNHYAEPKLVRRLPRGCDLITGHPIDRSFQLDPYGVAVIANDSDQAPPR
jgi:beta-galactosidase